MTYIGSWDGKTIDISTHHFLAEHEKALLMFADNGEFPHDHVAWELDDMGLVEVARTKNYGSDMLTGRGKNVVQYIRANPNWRD